MASEKDEALGDLREITRAIMGVWGSLLEIICRDQFEKLPGYGIWKGGGQEGLSCWSQWGTLWISGSGRPSDPCYGPHLFWIFTFALTLNFNSELEPTEHRLSRGV